MCAILYYTLKCPKCGKRFNWCNGGDVIYSVEQLKATCPGCGYKNFAGKFEAEKEVDTSLFFERSRSDSDEESSEKGK